MLAPHPGGRVQWRGSVVLLNPPFDGPVVRDNYCSFVPKGDYLWPPSDLLVASGWLHEDFRLRVIDAVARRLAVDACLAELLDIGPDAVFMLSSEATWRSDVAFTRRLRETLPRARLVVGCSPLSAGSPRTRFSAADAVLRDFSGPALRDYLLDGTATPEILIEGAGGEDDLAVPTPTADYPMPRHELFELRRYALPLGWSGGLATVLTSFGCAHHCDFCAGGALPWARRPLSSVIEELQHVRAQGVRNVFFADYTFTTERRYVLDLCRAMAEMSPGLRWTCLARPDQLDEETVRAMAASGCGLVQLGVESGDDAILARYSKGFTVAQVRRAFALCREAGLPTLGFFIIGLPGQDEASVVRTIDLALELDPDLASFAVPTPDPGTVLGRVMDDAEVRSTSGPIVESALLDEEAILRLHATAVWRFYTRPRFLVRQLAASASAGDIKRKLLGGARLLGGALRNRRLSRY